MLRRCLGLSVVVLACVLSVATSPPQGATVRAEANGGTFPIVAGGAPLEIHLTASTSREALAGLAERGGNATLGITGVLTIPGLNAEDELPGRPALRAELVRDLTPNVVDERNHELFFDGQRIFSTVNVFGDCDPNAAERDCEEGVTVRLFPPDDLRGLEDVVLDWDARAEVDFAFFDDNNSTPPGATVDVRVDSVD